MSSAKSKFVSRLLVAGSSCKPQALSDRICISSLKSSSSSVLKSKELRGPPCSMLELTASFVCLDNGPTQDKFVTMLGHLLDIRWGCSDLFVVLLRVRIYESNMCSYTDMLHLRN